MKNKQYVLGSRKLDNDEFSKKYWLNGDAQYQFHTMDIDDGNDERQQLLINNDRTLYQIIEFYSLYNRKAHAEFHDEIRMCKKKMFRLAVCTIILNIFIWIIYLLCNQ